MSTHAPHGLLAELAAGVTVEPDGVATVVVGSWLLAAWDNIDGTVTVAAYTLPDGRCLHLWTGPADAPHEASDALRAGGLPVRHCSLQPAPRRPAPSGVELTGGDALDLFAP